MAATKGLIDAAEVTRNPHVLSFALLAYGIAFRDADPDRAREAMRRGVVIAHDSGNRANETHLAANLARLEAEHGDPLAALDHITRGDPQLPRLRQHHDDPCRTGYPRRLFQPARTLRISGDHRRIRAQSHDRGSRVPELSTAITHLRDVLGDQTYESLARRGETMTTAAMATYALDQIDQARAELNAVSK